MSQDLYTRTKCGCFSDLFHGSLMQCPLQQCQLHHCPFNEVISRHMGADVAKKTHCDVIVIDAHLPPYPLHNLADGIRITTGIMWRQLSPWRPGSHRCGSRLISGTGGEANQSDLQLARVVTTLKPVSQPSSGEGSAEERRRVVYW